MSEPVTKRRPMIDMEEFERRLRQSSGSGTDDDPLAQLARVICGQKGSVQTAEPQGKSAAAARQVQSLSSKVQESETQDPDPLRSSGDDKIACQDSGILEQEIASARLLYFVIIAAIIIVGVLGVGASIGYKGDASPAPEIATISDKGPAKSQSEKTNLSDVPNPITSILSGAPQPSQVSDVSNAEQPVDQSQPRETIPAVEVAASPEKIETQVQPPSETASIEPEQMNSASVHWHDAIPSDMPPRAEAKLVPLPVPRPAVF